MIRVLKPNGYIYINTHDYRFPYERHYKIVFPAFLPKVFGYLYLLLKGKPIKFLRHINYVPKLALTGYYMSVKSRSVGKGFMSVIHI